MSLSPRRIVGIAVGAVAILGIGVYGPAMLLGPLPSVSVQVDDAAVAASEATPGTPIAMPESGASALALVSDDGSAETIALGGDPAAVPIGGAAKLVTVLVALESLPLPADGDGPGIPIGPADYTDYLRYSGEGSRTLQVSPGETWSQRDVVRAVLLASSNNHADTLARWAFGDVALYVDAANAWLAEQGFSTVRVDDATGLSGDNVGSAEEVAALAARVLGVPELAAMYSDSGPAAVGSRNVPDVVDHLGEAGVRTLTRSYTDQGGLGLVYTAEVAGADGEESHRVVGAMLLMPDYETLDPAVTAALESTAAAATPVTVITAGMPYATVEAPWGDQAELVASVDRADVVMGWRRGRRIRHRRPVRDGTDGRSLGRVTCTRRPGDLASPLVLAGDIRDPGALWRLTNPVALVGRSSPRRGDRRESRALVVLVVGFDRVRVSASNLNRTRNWPFTCRSSTASYQNNDSRPSTAATMPTRDSGLPPTRMRCSKSPSSGPSMNSATYCAPAVSALMSLP